jgi:DNA-binding NarL/FixJ family response regulator
VKPLVVVEGADGAYADALAEVRAAGWRVVSGWQARGPDTVCTGRVASAEEAAAALLAGVGGAGLVIDARADREIVDRLCDDLRRLGRLDHRVGAAGHRPRLTREEQALVGLLLAGATLGAAARELGLSRRTADRRLASVRAKLGVRTTAEALVRLATRVASPAAPGRGSSLLP